MCGTCNGVICLIFPLHLTCSGGATLQRFGAWPQLWLAHGEIFTSLPDIFFLFLDAFIFGIFPSETLIFYVVSFEIFSFFHPIFPTLVNAGEALHLEVRIRPSPSLQATPVRVLKIVPEYPHVITFLKYSASLNWNLSSVYIRDRCYMLCHLQMFCWWYLHDHKGHPINIKCPFQGNICHCCLNRR